MQKVQYCPECHEEEPTFEFQGDLRVLIRCQVCGYPVSEVLSESMSASEDAAAVSAVTTESVEISVVTTEPEEPGPLVLHIDDDPLLLRVVSDALKRGGYTPLSAEDGNSGLELAKKEKPSAVLLDVMMPDPDGYKVCRLLRALPGLSHAAIIMLTASSDPKLDTKAFESGADLAIRKPFEEKKLLSTLRTALRLKGVHRIL